MFDFVLKMFHSAGRAGEDTRCERRRSGGTQLAHFQAAGAEKYENDED